MSLVEHLLARSGDYELLAAWHAERAPLDEQHAIASHAMLLVGIALREVAEAVELEWGEQAP
jgi:hypothetical protein